jgi:hypothetical protein
MGCINLITSIHFLIYIPVSPTPAVRLFGLRLPRPVQAQFQLLCFGMGKFFYFRQITEKHVWNSRIYWSQQG